MIKLSPHKLSIIRRYLYGSLAIAIIPLILISLLYDQFSSNLLNDLLSKKLESELESANIKIKAFLGTQKQRVENLADLPNITTIFDPSETTSITNTTYDFLYFEAENPDIYEIIFLDIDDQIILSVPRSNSTIFKDTNISSTWMENLEILGPVTSEPGRPGWIMLKKSVLINQEKIGSIGIKLRLSSLTELSTSLFQQNLYQPLLFFGDNQAWSATGIPQQANDIIARSSEILPGWYIALDRSENQTDITNINMRYILLAIVIFSTITILLLFLHLAKKLNQMVLPLNEAAIKVAKGDLSVKVPEDGVGEIRNLALSFNKMTAQLRKFISSQIATERRVLLGNLAAGIAHELRNPLATIKTAIYGLKTDEQQEEKRLLLNVMDDEITRLDNIIDEFMEFAKPRDPSKSPTAVDQVIKSIKLLIDGTAKQQKVNIEVSIAPDIVIYVDPVHFRQVMINLFLNALEAMPDGGTLTIEAESQAEHTTITISDTGKGMDAELLSKIQDPFYTTKKKGLGLGLSICSQLMHANAANLQIDSSVNQGTSVILTIPQHNESSQDSDE